MDIDLTETPNNPDERAERYLLELHKGLTYRQVAEIHGVTSDAVRNVVRRYNERNTGRYTGINSLRTDLAQDLREEDVAETVQDIIDSVPSHRPTIVTIDIERLPRVIYEWHPRHRDGWTPESMVIEPSRMVSFAAKTLRGPVFFSSEFHHGRDKMLQSLWNVLNKADIIVSYNGKRFDIPHIAGELRDAKYPIYSPFKQIDLLQSIKSKFAYDYKTLSSVAKRWGLLEKMDTGGFDLWKRCYSGDPEAWDLMRKYNMQDVRVTEAMYLDNVAWLSGSIPNLGLWTNSNDGYVCPACSSHDVVEDGTASTGATLWVAYRCEQCGYRSRSNEKVSTTTLRPVTW